MTRFTFSLLALAASSLPALAHELPLHAHIVYEARLGTLPVGRAEQSWTISQGHYTLNTELAPIFGPHIRYLSHGEISKRGVEPADYAEFRGNDQTPQRLIRFDWSHSAVQYGPPDSLTDGKLEAGAQELNVLPFQLAWLGNKTTAMMQIATGRKLFDDHFGIADPVRVTVMGQGQDTRIWHTPAGEDKTEVWLAPALANLPVRIIRTTDKGELDLIAKSVEFDSDTP